MIHGFSKSVYLEANPDILKAMQEGGMETLEAYLTSGGLDDIKSGKRKFHKDFQPFDETRYLETYPDIQQAVSDGVCVSGFEHFCHHGYEEIIQGTRAWERTASRNITFFDLSDEELYEYHIINSHTLDWSQYAKSNKHKFISDDPIVDYIKNWKEYHPDIPGFFNTAFYVIHYPDIKEAGINPLFHYLIDGKKEGRHTFKKRKRIKIAFIEKFFNKNYSV